MLRLLLDVEKMIQSLQKYRVGLDRLRCPPADRPGQNDKTAGRKGCWKPPPGRGKDERNQQIAEKDRDIQSSEVCAVEFGQENYPKR